MRAVWNATRMERDRGRLDSATRSEISAHVKKNLVGFDIVMHPGNFHCFGMRIEQTRRERAHNITTDLKCLMNRRRLMNRTRDRLEILRIECERINVSVPADDIEGMMRHRHNCPARPIFD